MNFSVSRVEWRWVAVGAAVILLLSSLPVLTGRLSQTAQERFSGAVYDRQDYAVHLATMHLGARGSWGYQLSFTSEEHPARFVKLAYLLLGKLAAGLGLESSQAYELARLLMGLGLILGLYSLISLLTAERKIRYMALLLAIFGSGLGWLMLLINWLPDTSISPIDFWLIDAYAFFGMMTLPHFSLAILLAVGMLIAGTAFLRQRKSGALIAVGVLGLIIVAIEPTMVVIADLALLGLLIGFWRKAGRLDLGSGSRLILAASAQIPLLAYNYWALGSHPVWEDFTAQFIHQSPPPIYYLAGFGLLLPFAIWGAWLNWRKKNPIGIMFAFWALSAAALLYAPVTFQRRFAMGLSIPIGVMAAYGFWFGFVDWLRRRNASGAPLWGFVYQRRWALAGLWALFASLSSLYLVFGGALLASLRPAALFDPRDVIQATEWLEGHAGPDDSVFSAERTGLVIPSYTGLRVYLGHPIETVDYGEKREVVEGFYTVGGMSDPERRQVLLGCGCDWLFLGPFERQIGDFRPDDLGVLEMAYQNPTVKVYRVNR